jgi:hypothetical protein
MGDFLTGIRVGRVVLFSCDHRRSNYTRAEWEVALRSAKHKAMEGEWLVIRPGDFFR